MHFLAAKKNAKRKAAKARKAAETRVDPENEVIEDISCEFIKKLKNSEILAISEKIQIDEKLSKYFKIFDKSLKLPY